MSLTDICSLNTLLLFSEVVQDTHYTRQEINIDILLLIELKLSIATVNYSALDNAKTEKQRVLENYDRQYFHVDIQFS